MRAPLFLCSFLVSLPALAAGQAPANVVSATDAAVANERAPGGTAFDEAVGARFGDLHGDTLAKCAGSAYGRDLAHFDLLLQLDASGTVIEALVYPETSVAECVRPAVEHNVLVKPPRGGYWVRVGVNLTPPGMVSREPGGVRLYLEQGHSLLIAEPANWAPATVKDIPVDLIFFPKATVGDVSKAHIRVLAFKKSSDNTQEDLEADIAGYRKRFKTVRFEDFAVSHPTFRLFPKKFVLPGEMYEFVTYVNPGPTTTHAFTVSLVKAKKDVSPGELKTYLDLVKSLQVE